MPQRVLIAGCGDVGSALGILLAEAGHEVWGLRREVERLPAAIQPVAADLLAPASLRRLPRGVETIFYTAAASSPGPDDYRDAYVVGLENLLAVLEERDDLPEQLFFTSSTSVYGQTDGSWVDESSPTQPTRTTGGILLEAERLTSRMIPGGVVVRFSGIYGPGRTRLVDKVRSGTAVLQPEPPYWTNRIHRDDCARVLAHLMGLARPAPVYLASDDDPAPVNTVLSWLAERLLRPPLPVTEQRDPATGENKRCSNQRLRASGFQFRYPSYREGYATLL